jgi:hypothetical protein
VLPDDARPELIEVISIGPKPQVYFAAAERHGGE